MLDFELPRITSFYSVPAHLTLGLARPQVEPFLYSPEAVAFLKSEGAHDHDLVAQSHAPKSLPIRQRGSLFAGLKPHLNGDAVFANLEGALSKRGRPSSIDMNYRADPRFAAVLKEAGFDVLSLANNHCMDFGEVAFGDTVAALKGVGVRVTGAGRNEREARRGTVIASPNGKIGFLAYNNVGPHFTYAGPDWSGCSPANRFVLREDIPRMRDRADLVAVSLHWGQEMAFEPAPAERELAHLAIDLGADCILGHHSHMPGPVEMYRGKPIIYSTGNAVFGHDHPYWTGGTMWKLEFSHKGALVRGTVWPLTKASSTDVPRVARAQEAGPLLPRLAMGSKALGTVLELWDGAGVLHQAS
jgi:poly-gamma-glutamate synthesis protein (capsule biosynthesis protein)